MRRLISLIALAIVVVIPDAAAQDAKAGGDIPGPEECRVAPRPAASLAGTPGPEIDPALQAAFAATPVPAGDLPAGEPADEATVAGITATLRELVACIHAGDREQMLSLFSDDFSPAGLFTLGVYDVYLFGDEVTPVPAADRVPVPPVREVKLLDDGRAGAVLVAAEPEVTVGPTAVFIVFVDVNGRWLIDEVAAADLGDQATPAAAGEPSPVAIEGDDFAGAIVPEVLADGFFFAFFGEHADGYWTPAEADARALETAIVSFLRRLPDNAGRGVAPDLWERLPGYARQYVGIVEEDRRLIFANFFCDDLGIDWMSVPVAVDDGGDCFFQVRYDVANGTFSDLAINGEG